MTPDIIAALKKYGEHLNSCAVNAPWSTIKTPCDCGFDDVLAALSTSPAGQEVREKAREAMAELATYSMDISLERWNELSNAILTALSSVEPAGNRREADWLTRRIAEVVEEDGGCWRACSGCQESVDGCVSARDYPYSAIFKCQPGSGCRECGGLGAIYDDGAFLAGYGEVLSSPPAAEQEAVADIEQVGLNIAERIRQEMASARQWWRDGMTPGQLQEFEAELASTCVAVCEAELAPLYATTPTPALDGVNAAFELMQKFYLSDRYDPKAARPADNVQAAIAFTLAAIKSESVADCTCLPFAGKPGDCALHDAALSSPSEGESAPASSGAGEVQEQIKSLQEGVIGLGQFSTELIAENENLQVSNDLLRDAATSALAVLDADQYPKIVSDLIAALTSPLSHDAEGESATVSREEELREALLDIAKGVFIDAATQVHHSWVDGTNGREPDFGEAASDYAASFIDAYMEVVSDALTATPATSTERGR